MSIQHHLDCTGADVYLTRGITHDLASCRACGAQEWVNER